MGDFKMGRTKVVRRSVAIALVVLCVILLSTIFGIVAYYADSASRINSLQSEVDRLNRIVTFAESRVIASSSTISQPAGYSTGINFTAEYAGYVLVEISYSTTSNTTVAINYVSGIGPFYFKEGVGSANTRWYAIVPAVISVLIGNNNIRDSATEVVSITYVY